MVIATNKAHFSNQTNAYTGTLRSAGQFFMGANDVFLGFKPASVCKKSGFLRVTGTGSVNLSANNAPLKMTMIFTRPGVDTFIVNVLDAGIFPPLPGTSKAMFSFHVDIPVGTTGHSELDNVVVTSQWSTSTLVHEAYSYITADPDDLWTATFYYEVPASSQPYPAGHIKIQTIVAEYKEN